ncbi:MAG: shikimate dehydrogenase [Armatimonadetes bacterium]|nr:shikimate dehydrogenase [Armatimonadota bacterium]
MNEVFDWKNAPSAEFAVIGHPISHSLSPKMHAAAFAALGLSSSYVAIEVQPGEVDSALDHLASLGYRGVNVTVPHKEDAFRWCETVSDVAQRLHVCNTLDLQKRDGTNTDGIGFIRSLNGHDFGSRQALVLGAGGSARSILDSLLADGWEVFLWNRTQSRAEELIERFGFEATVIDRPSLAGKSLVVNTTSASLGGHRLPLQWSEASHETLAYDLAYGHGLTPFLADAAEHGLPVLDGRKMLMEQGAAAFEFWWGKTAPRKEMLAALQ